MPRLLLALTAAAVIAALPARAGDTPAPAGARVYFIGIADGVPVKSPFLVRFGLSGMGVAPAGVEKEGTGHHHLLIDTTLTPADAAAPLPADEKHVHFGKGQTETMVKLAPGRHTLQIVLADHNHIPHAPPVVSNVITVDVTE